jgi:hypothetical protein
MEDLALSALVQGRLRSCSYQQKEEDVQVAFALTRNLPSWKAGCLGRSLANPEDSEFP